MKTINWFRLVLLSVGVLLILRHETVSALSVIALAAGHAATAVRRRITKP